MEDPAHRARFWRTAAGGAVECMLCPHGCVISNGEWGICRARKNEGGELASPFLGQFSSIAVDPIEKKPLYDWRRGSFILSFGSLGCNMRCPFCQNHTIAFPEERVPLHALSPGEIAGSAIESGLSSVAYTYNEPAIHSEFIIEASKTLKKHGIATVLVTNGMVCRPALDELIKCVDAANIDIKAFDPMIYNRLGGDLDAVLETISAMHGRGVHVELTHLVVPKLTDSSGDFSRMVDWIAELSPDIPLHISRYFPRRNWSEPPTAEKFLFALADMASKRLHRVYVGNVGAVYRR